MTGADPAEGLGDDNPIYTDPEIGATTRWNGIVENLSSRRCSRCHPSMGSRTNSGIYRSVAAW